MGNDKNYSNQDKTIRQVEYGPTIKIETREVEK